ncbi:hypothetical protein ATANTOWER_015517 [Ataeniobius toweri]|uniref:Uncharacterized protein n=1 Tax=Ataeniobius toweri TaxID=208326 RepID=A0ABU7C1U3_9TELE|nr:hypothetical protein [Ataeniobius toweri]
MLRPCMRGTKTLLLPNRQKKIFLQNYLCHKMFSPITRLFNGVFLDSEIHNHEDKDSVLTVYLETQIKGRTGTGGQTWGLPEGERQKLVNTLGGNRETECVL